MPKVIGEIKQSGGKFAIVDSNNIRGGFMQLSTTEQRDTLHSDLLRKHMLVHVADTGKIWEYMGDKWVPFSLASTGVDSSSHQFLTISSMVNEVIEEEAYYKIIFENEVFQGNDIIGWGINDNLEGNYVKVKYVRDGAVYINKEGTPPSKYSTVILVGSTSDEHRQLVLCYHKHNGAMVLSQFLNRSLEGLNENYFFRLGQHGTNYWKVYGEDVYFKGTFIDEQGRDLAALATLNQNAINTGITAVRSEFGHENLLNNPYFVSGLDCWVTANTANFFKLRGKWVLTNKTILSNKRDGAFVIDEDGKNVLRMVQGFVTQRNENLRKITNLDEMVNPYYVTLVFKCLPVTGGTLTVSMVGEDSSGYGETPNPVKATTQLEPMNEYGTFRASFLWNGTGDFKLAYTGEIKIQTLVIKINEVKNLELKYKELFDNKETLLQMIELFKTQTS